MTARSSHVSTQWVWWSLLPVGFGAWVPIYAGLRARRAWWAALGVLFTVIGAVGLAMSNGHNSKAGQLMIVAWAGGAISAFMMRGPYVRALTDPRERKLAAARQRIESREQARELAARDPALAREVGIGRPDVRGALDGGVVDVNAAPPDALAALPGVDGHLARQITSVRERVNGFSSIEDMGSLLDLDPALVERLRDLAVFLPPGKL